MPRKRSARSLAADQAAAHRLMAQGWIVIRPEETHEWIIINPTDVPYYNVYRVDSNVPLPDMELLAEGTHTS